MVSVAEPHPAFRHIAESFFIEVCKQSACTDICPRILACVLGLHFLKPGHTFVKVLDGTFSDDGCIENCHAVDGIVNGDAAVGITTSAAVPLASHQTGLPKQSVYLFVIPITIESDDRTECLICSLCEG